MKKQPVVVIGDANVDLVIKMPKPNEIKEIETLRIKHMNVEIDKNGNMIYIRKLVDGVMSNTSYGVEIARKLGLECNVKFITNAEKIRKKLLNKSDQED